MNRLTLSFAALALTLVSSQSFADTQTYKEVVQHNLHSALVSTIILDNGLNRENKFTTAETCAVVGMINAKVTAAELQLRNAELRDLPVGEKIRDAVKTSFRALGFCSEQFNMIDGADGVKVGDVAGLKNQNGVLALELKAIVEELAK